MKAQNIVSQMKNLNPVHANTTAFFDKFDLRIIFPRNGIPLNRKVEKVTVQQTTTAPAQQENTPAKISLTNPTQEKPAPKPAVNKPVVKGAAKKPVAAKSATKKPAAKPRVKPTK